jgi:hypothetical protein
MLFRVFAASAVLIGVAGAAVAAAAPAPDTYIGAPEAAQADLASWFRRAGAALARAQ